MGKKEFVKWATEAKCLPEEEAKEWWDQLKDDPSVDWEHKGRGGRLQLFIPNAVVRRERLRDRYIDNAQEEGSAPLKKPRRADIDDLRAHVERQDIDFANDFLGARRTKCM
jgi:hypothetical protein